MDEVKKAVETAENAAPQPGVESPGTVAPQTPTSAEVDLAAELEAVRTERDNYKKGMLKSKGKLPEDEENQENLDEVIARKVQEALNSTRDADLEAREKAAIEKILKENRELKLATQNRSQIGAGAGQGASIESQPSTTDTFFSAEQLAEFKKRKLDPEKVKQNILRNRR